MGIKILFLGFQCLFSVGISSTDEISFKKLINFYSTKLDVVNSLAELKLWSRKLRQLKQSNINPKTGIEAFKLCNIDIYPNIHFLLKILCTLPVSTSTPERTFSSLKRIKTYLRNSMTEVIKYFKLKFNIYHNIIMLFINLFIGSSKWSIIVGHS